MSCLIDKASTGVCLSPLHQVREVHHPALLVIHMHLGPAHSARDNDPVLQLNGARVSKKERILKYLSMVKMYSIGAMGMFTIVVMDNGCLRCVIFKREGGDTEAITGQLLTAKAAVFTTQEVNLSFKKLLSSPSPQPQTH